MARYERLFTRYLLGHFDEHAHDDDANDDPLLAEVAASAVVTAHNHVLRRWLRAGGQGDVETQLDHAFAIVRKTFGTGHRGRARHRGARTAPAVASVSAQGEVLVTVARTDAPLDEVMRTIEQALKDRVVSDRDRHGTVSTAASLGRRPFRRVLGIAPRGTFSSSPSRSIIAHVLRKDFI